MSLLEFYGKHLADNSRSFVNHAKKMAFMIGARLCASDFYHWWNTRKTWCPFNDSHLNNALRVATSSLPLNMESLSRNRQNHVSQLTTNLANACVSACVRCDWSHFRKRYFNTQFVCQTDTPSNLEEQCFYQCVL